MIWLSGQLGTVLDSGHRWDLGVMCQPTSTAIDGQLRTIRQSGVYWAVDNEAFSSKFSPERWEAWLRAVPRATRLTCLFVVAPDVLHRDDNGNVYGDPEATYALSPRYFPLLRSLAYRVAYVSQDGATRDLVPWDEIDCLFVGGSDAWKLSDASVTLIREAQERGLWTHMGRCQARESIGGRIGAAHALGIDSGDGTVLARDPSRLGRVVRGLDALNMQAPMLLEVTA
ncbi:MAG TPA: hypothetical protein VNG35_07110 [Gemmatimonadales bacterium]|nr:hypothetical protein [Gemmatimonadales bacterium]